MAKVRRRFMIPVIVFHRNLMRPSEMNYTTICGNCLSVVIKVTDNRRKPVIMLHLSAYEYYVYAFTIELIDGHTIFLHLEPS